MIGEEQIKVLFEHYDNRGQTAVCLDEFREDVRRFLYISRLLRRYRNSGSLNVRLLLNHIIILYNVFGNITTTVLIEYVPEDLHPELYGLLRFFNRLPIEYYGAEDTDIIEIISQNIDSGE